MSRHPRLLALGLLLLAPTVGEYLLGNIPLSQYASVVLLVPLYGAGALLVREVGRRLGGWPSIVLLAAAYALVEEAPVDQMVFNPGYLGMNAFPAGSVLPGLGISGTLVLQSLALHTVWSICVPVALVEAFDPRPTEPWLGRMGLGSTGAVFLAGCCFLGTTQAQDLDFVGSPAQFAVSLAAIGALVVAAVLVGRRSAPAPLPGVAPRARVVGLAAFLGTSGFWFVSEPPGLLLQTVVCAAAAGLAWTVVRRWSRRDGWDARRRLALAAGAAATYALWFGPAQALGAGTGPTEAAAGALVFGLLVGAVVVAGARRNARGPDRAGSVGAGCGR